jgi:excisionase family DNA binding protein
MGVETLYTARAASREFFRGRIGEASIRRLMNEGELKSLRVGIKRLIPESELRAFVERQVPGRG